jgi:hypothetical protein
MVLSVENAKERPRYRIAAMAREAMTKPKGMRVFLYFHVKAMARIEISYKVMGTTERSLLKPYWNRRVILLAINISDSCWNESQYVLFGSN